MILQRDEAQVEYLISVCLDIVLILMQDWCMLCAERTIASEIVLDAPDGTTRRRGSVEARYGPFGDSANLDAR